MESNKLQCYINKRTPQTTVSCQFKSPYSQVYSFYYKHCYKARLGWHQVDVSTCKNISVLFRFFVNTFLQKHLNTEVNSQQRAFSQDKKLQKNYCAGRMKILQKNPTAHLALNLYCQYLRKIRRFSSRIVLKNASIITPSGSETPLKEMFIP